jgi:acetyl esterase/lipase
MPRIRFPVVTALFLYALTSSVRPATADEPTVIPDVVYGHKAGMALVMEVLKPAKPNGIGVLFMVSGGWASDISMIKGGFLSTGIMKAFTDRGDTVFLVMHGSQPKFMLSEIVPDIHRAVRFIHVHAREYGVDPNRLGISGASSGGHLSTTIGTMGKPGDPAAADPVDRASSQVGAVACFFPPVDLVDYGKPGQTFLEFDAVKPFQHVFGALGKPRDEQIKILREFSPYYAISRQTAPTLILQGDMDPLVPQEQAERFMAKLAEMNVPHQLIIHKGGAHGWVGLDKDFSVLADWFDKYLSPRSAGAN